MARKKNSSLQLKIIKAIEKLSIIKSQVNNSLTDLMETDSPTDINNNNYSSKKGKIIPPDNLIKKVTEHNKWLNNIPVSNPFSVLAELDDEPTGSNIKTIEGYRETATKSVLHQYISKLKS